MPSLDTRGKIAAAEIAVYVPIAVITFILIVRYALRRDAGWLFLWLFALTRESGSALVIAGEMLPAQPVLLDASHVMDFAGLGALLLSTLGFLGMAGQHTYSENSRINTILRLTGLIILVGIGISIAGGVLGIQVHANQSTAKLLRRVGACIFAGSYVILFMVHIGTWTYRWHLRSYRRSLLFGISSALPFLGVRVAYSVLAAWSSSDLRGLKPSTNVTLAKLNPITGEWVLYLVLSVVMEFLVAALYLFASTVLARRHHH